MGTKTSKTATKFQAPSKKQIILLLLLLSVIAFFLRLYLFPENIFFGPEQGNDFKIIRDIAISHKFTLIGPKTDIPGVFHGPIFYYLATIPFYASHGDPFAVAIVMALLQALTVFGIYGLTKEVTNRRLPAFISASLFAVSFGSISYTRWISGQQLTIPLSIVFMYFLVRFIRGSKKSIFGVAIAFGLMGQSEFINFLLAASVGLVLVLVHWKKVWSYPKLLLFMGFLVALGFSLSNFVIFDLRHEFLITKSIAGLVGGKSGMVLTLPASIQSFYFMFLESAMNILGLPSRWITAVVIAISMLLLFMNREKMDIHYMLIWLVLPTVVLMALRHGSLEQLFVFQAASMVITVSIALWIAIERFPSFIGYTFFGLLVASNLYCVFAYLPTNTRVFFQTTQPALRYKDQMEVINYVYDKAKGKDFYFQTYTIPYFWQDAWEYLFWRYGSIHKVKLPDEKHDELLYVIIQKDRINPPFQEDWYRQTVSKWGTLQQSVTIGELTVEERVKESRYAN